MKLQDTPARYGAVSVFNHWLGAALIVALLAAIAVLLVSGGRDSDV